MEAQGPGDSEGSDEECYRLAGRARLIGRLAILVEAREIGRFRVTCSGWRLAAILCFVHWEEVTAGRRGLFH